MASPSRVLRNIRTATPDGLGTAVCTLLGGCPLTGDNPVNCPLHGVRELEPAEARAWLARLSPAEQEFLLIYHNCCAMAQVA